jgi:MYXO-CTERM domain-containing protein
MRAIAPRLNNYWCKNRGIPKNAAAMLGLISAVGLNATSAKAQTITIEASGTLTTLYSGTSVDGLPINNTTVASLSTSLGGVLDSPSGEYVNCAVTATTFTLTTGADSRTYTFGDIDADIADNVSGQDSIAVQDDEWFNWASGWNTGNVQDYNEVGLYGTYPVTQFTGESLDQVANLTSGGYIYAVNGSISAAFNFQNISVTILGAGLDPNAVPVATATSTQTASVAGNYSTPGTGQTFTYAAYEILPGAVASLALGDTLDLTSGPLYIAAGGTFNASGTVNGNIINAGLVHITAPSFSTFTNQGTVVFQPPTGGATYSFQSFTNDAGGTFYGGGEAASPVVINLPAGQALQNEGEAVVGDLTVNGSYTQTSTGETLFDLGGPDPIYGYSQLTVNGTVDLAGTIQTDYINDFYPTVGETFDLLIASGGIILNPDFTGMPQEPGFSYALVDDDTVFEATFTGVVPEPAALSLLGVCGLGLLRRRPSCGRERIERR